MNYFSSLRNLGRAARGKPAAAEQRYPDYQKILSVGRFVYFFPGIILQSCKVYDRHTSGNVHLRHAEFWTDNPKTFTKDLAKF